MSKIKNCRGAWVHVTIRVVSIGVRAGDIDVVSAKSASAWLFSSSKEIITISTAIWFWISSLRLFGMLAVVYGLTAFDSVTSTPVTPGTRKFLKDAKYHASMGSQTGPSEDSKEQIREEARHVIDGQLQTLRDTDRKAMATARINGLILGLLASAASIADNPTRVINDWMIYGGVALLGSLSVAVLTYTVDRPSYGLGPGYFDTELDTFNTDTAVSDDILNRYADWIADNSEEISTNGTYLFVSQLFFLFGLMLLAWGVNVAI